ncbi:Plug domain-containing protein [Thiomicrospira sp. R3]|uniref:Plug domain-containing protein n=1 Tax=Thiomicrospira sp. R3 TaxID=3035472 RepID=UPI00259B7609|nr:Plug domain-containing protein [Thiomicrospira sp. R3]WFE69464.1 Plug domain-containing protein [Thiomicrospira sp. R3]
MHQHAQRSYWPLLALTAVMIGWSASSLAQDACIQSSCLSAIQVVSTTKTERSLADVPVRTEVVSAAQVERTHAKDLNEALKYVPGLQLRPIHGKSGYGIWLQGLDANRVLVLVDGHPVSASTGSAVDTTQVAVDGRVQWVNNAQLEVERDGSDAAMTTRLRSALSYKLNSNWTAGIEGFWDYEVIKEEVEWEFDHWDLFAGPMIAYNDKTWRAAFTLMPQIMGSDERDTGKTGLHLADHEKLNARLVVARKF